PADCCQPLLRELLKIELFYRCREDQLAPQRSEYFERFPDFEEIIDSVFDHALSQMLLVQSPSPTDLLRKNNPFKLPAHLALGPGSELGNYELVELLGQGGMG